MTPLQHTATHTATHPLSRFRFASETAAVFFVFARGVAAVAWAGEEVNTAGVGVRVRVFVLGGVRVGGGGGGGKAMGRGGGCRCRAVK